MSLSSDVLSKPSNEVSTQVSDQVSAQALTQETHKLSRLHPARQLSVAEQSSIGSPYPLSPLPSASASIADGISVAEYEQALAIEATVAIVINGIHYAVLMASPSDLEYLGIGFLFSEGLITRIGELLDWEVTQVDAATLETLMQSEAKTGQQAMQTDVLMDNQVYLINLRVTQRCHQRLQAQRRQLSGRTGCGMCGMTALAQALPDLSGYCKGDNTSDQQSVLPPPSLPELLALREQMESAQQAHLSTGAVHAAGSLIDNKLIVFEDVGRHNALDKLIGWQLRHKAELHLVVMTSRLSIELVQKSIRAQIHWLVGMSAPTSTAVSLARRYGLGVAGFLRDNRVTYYAPQRDK